MRQDQFEKLQDLHEKLTDVFLTEADPDQWPGHGIDLKAMDKQTRGDRYWCKKNAVATIAVMQRITSLVDHIHSHNPDAEPDPTGVEPEEDLDAEVEAAEKEAKALLNKVQGGAAKAAFDKRVHGKS